MDRVALKNKARTLIKGNLWYIWKPLVMFSLCAFGVGFIAGIIGSTLSESGSRTLISIVSSLISLIESAFLVAYAKYVLEFIRGNKMEWKETLTLTKEHFGLYILVTLLVGVIICIGSILLVIPGIIAAIGLCFYKEVCADNPDLGVIDVVKKAWEITKGHKGELFVLGLSFIGWAIVASLTLGILYIWLMPYMTVTFALAYEELKK